MKVMNIMDTTEALARATKSWCLFLSHACDDNVDGGTHSELRRACPILDDSQIMRLIGGGACVVVYEDEDTAMAAFGRVVGDGGPTKTNPYKGPARVFAYLCGPDGGITENT